MATNKSLKNQLIAKKEQNINLAANNILNGLLSSEEVKKKFKEILKDRAPQYISSILETVNEDTSLQGCEPMSVNSAVLTLSKDL